MQTKIFHGDPETVEKNINAYIAAVSAVLAAPGVAGSPEIPGKVIHKMEMSESVHMENKDGFVSIPHISVIILTD